MVESTIKERLAMIQKMDTAELSMMGTDFSWEKPGLQVEQMIQQAQDELKLIPKLAAARVWETYTGPPAESILADLKK